MSFNRRAVLGFLSATIWPLRALAEDRSPKLPNPKGPAAPALATPPAAQDDGFTVLETREGTIRLEPAPARPTAVWGYNGEVPGPLLRVKKGAELKVRLRNKLNQPVTLSWQGMRGPNAMDGIAGLTQVPVAPGGSFDYRFTPPDSGLFWYHSHVWPHTAEQTGRGLYGVLIVDELDPPPFDEELLIVFDDWGLDAKAGIKSNFGDIEQASHDGRIGPLMTVNSQPVPLVSSMRPGSRVRLRLLSVANARILIATFGGTHPKIQAIDSQPCEIFEPAHQTLPVGPGARFDVMIDLPGDAGKEASLAARWPGEPDRPLLVFKTVGEPRKPREPAVDLPANPALPIAIPLETALKMDLVIEGGAKPPLSPSPARQKGGAGEAPSPKPASAAPVADPAKLWTINGVASDGFSGKPLFKVKRGQAVSLALINKSAFPQQIQIRGHVLRLLHDLDDGWDPYWRDTVLIGPGRTKHVAFVADNPGKWAIESLILDRQVAGLAAWFEVG